MKVCLKKDEELAGVTSDPSRQRVYYGWVILPIAMIAFVATSPGQTFGVSIFNESIRVELGLSHASLAAAYTFGTLAAAIPLSFVGILMDRHGLRKVMIAVVALFGLACLFTSQASGWVMLFFGFMSLRMLGPGALALLSSNTLAFWFHRSLGLVEGIRHVGMAIAMSVIPLGSLWLLSEFGWRGSYVLMGLLVWLVLLPLVLFVYRERPEDVGQFIDNLPTRSSDADKQSRRPVERAFTLAEALRTRSFWIVACGTSTFGIIHTAVFFCIVPIFLDQGLSENQAAEMLTVFAVSLASMQLIGGILADRLPANLLMPVAMGFLAGSIALLSHLKGPLIGHISGMTLGVSQGLFFAASNPLWARYFGRLHLGRIRGTVSTVNIGSSSVGPLLCGLFRDSLGSYDAILTIFAVIPLPLLLLTCLASPPALPDDPSFPRSPPKHKHKTQHSKELMKASLIERRANPVIANCRLVVQDEF